MTNERQIEIIIEAKKRCNLWLTNSTFDEMTIMGSKMRFAMSIGFLGRPFLLPKEIKNWLKPKDFVRFVTDKEWQSKEIDIIIDTLYNYAFEVSIGKQKICN
jgi:hypothetical protein